MLSFCRIMVSFTGACDLEIHGMLSLIIFFTVMIKQTTARFVKSIAVKTKKLKQSSTLLFCNIFYAVADFSACYFNARFSNFNRHSLRIHLTTSY
ncbi:hypothetical protein GCM10022392_03990 [Mucilaginibacter panaciglaebae]|uniref:Secreted protein n=1 Tax=Mucilaginibacter panaciglaebae TaxID=502331 RepID=A0ABP7WDH8_9SPHI